MAHWLRFERAGKPGFGTLAGGVITVHSGDMFGANKPTGENVKLAEVRVLTPCDPSKMICLWNNFHQLAAKNNFLVPDEPLYFLKAPTPITRMARRSSGRNPMPAASSMRASSASSSARNARW